MGVILQSLEKDQLISCYKCDQDPAQKNHVFIDTLWGTILPNCSDTWKKLIGKSYEAD